MSIPANVNPLLLAADAAAAGGLQVSRSLRFNSADSAYLSRTPASAGNRRTWTWSGWVKRSVFGSDQMIFTSRPTASPYALFYFTSSDYLQFSDDSFGYIRTASVFRDPSAWYHILLTVDTTGATAADYLKIYVNNVRQAIGASSLPALNSQGQINTATAHSIGSPQPYANNEYFNGYLANIHHIDGQALTPASFAETDATTGQWIPKAYSGSYGLVSVAAATGALPIFNTTDTYGAAKGSGTRTDASSSSIVLALPMDGTNGGTSFGDQSAVIKGSGVAKTITVNGNTSTSTAQSKFYGSSGYFDGSGDYLQATTGTLSGDFCVEAWWYPSASGQQTLFSLGDSATATGIELYRSSGSNALSVYGGAAIISPGVDYIVGAWQHYALTRSGTTLRLFQNGVQIGSTTTSAAIDSTLRIGVEYYSSTLGQYLSGYVQDFRIYSGVAKYTSNFSPVVSYNNSFYLKFDDNSSNTASTLGKDTSGNGNNWTPNNFSVSDGIVSVAAATGALPIYNTTDTYGAVKGTGTRTDTNSASIVLALPMDGANNGTTFTDESATIRGSGTPISITANSVITSTSDFKFYGSSGYFNGSTYLSNSSTASLGSGNWSVEFWYKHTRSEASSSTGVGLASNGTDLIISISTWGSQSFIEPLYTGTSTSGGFSNKYTGTTGLVPGVWNHIAITRNSGDYNTYINGVISSYSSRTNESTVYNVFRSIGARPGRGTDITGYMQDLRVYTGVAKYTGNFNPPSSTQNATIAAGNDSLIDSPTNGSQSDTGVGGEVRGNYCTLNPLQSASAVTLSNGNLDWVTTNVTPFANAVGSIGMSSGKWYCEITISQASSTVGICKSSIVLASNPSNDANAWAYYYSGNKTNNGSDTSYGASYTTGDVIGIAFDADAGSLVFYKNGSSQGTAFTSLTTGPYFIFVGDQSTPGVGGGYCNFGQRAFAYTAPSGFKALCTQNLPAPLVTKSNTVMDVALWTGNNSSPRSITGLEFNPDFVWIKERSAASYYHRLFDAVRGTSNSLYLPGTEAENTYSSGYANVSSFDSSGFTLTNTNGGNNSGVTYVGWAWDAGTSTVTNNSGSISSQVRANVSAGFSVITATTTNTSTQTFGHGLNVAPVFHIIKLRNGVDEWYVYHSSVGATKYLKLNSTAAQTTSSAVYNDTAPTSSLITLGSGWNSTSYNIVCYAFAPVVGYSSFGSYVGNGSATDGPFIYTGMRSRWIMIKRTDTGGSANYDWMIYDTARDTYNLSTKKLTPNSIVLEGQDSDGAATDKYLDILSNGFKIKVANAGINGSGGTFIYFAVAESPFQYARAR